MWFWVADLLIPAFMAGFGALLIKKRPNYKNTVWGYHTERTTRSRHTWEYAHVRLGQLWFKTGTLLCVVVIMHRILSGMPDVFITALNIAAGLALLFAALPVVEKEVEQKFDRQGKPLNGRVRPEQNRRRIK